MSFDIKNQFLKPFVYIDFLIGTPVTLIWNLSVPKTKMARIIGKVYPMICIVFILVVNPIKILFSSGAWCTQEVLYKNKHLSFKKVEFQMLDVGALGYKKRTVEVMYITPLFMITSQTSNDIDKLEEWIKVNEDVNELKLK
jgi:hypothetical protein